VTTAVLVTLFQMLMAGSLTNKTSNESGDGGLSLLPSDDATLHNDCTLQINLVASQCLINDDRQCTTYSSSVILPAEQCKDCTEIR
jgi:hypothetical protein